MEPRRRCASGAPRSCSRRRLAMVALAGDRRARRRCRDLAVVLGGTRVEAARARNRRGPRDRRVAVGAGDRRAGSCTVAARVIPIARLLELVVPGSFGSTASGARPRGDRRHARVLPSLYVGAGVLALASLAITRRIAIAAAAILALGFATSFELQLAVLAVLAIARSAEGLEALFAGRAYLRARDRRRRSPRAALVALAVLRRVTTRPMLERTLAHGALGASASRPPRLIAWRAPQAMWRAPILLALVVGPGVGALGIVAPLAERSIVEEAPPWVAGDRRAAAAGARVSAHRDARSAAPSCPTRSRRSPAPSARAGASRSADVRDPARPPLTDRDVARGRPRRRRAARALRHRVRDRARADDRGRQGARPARRVRARRAIRPHRPPRVALDWTFGTDLGRTYDLLFPLEAAGRSRARSCCAARAGESGEQRRARAVHDPSLASRHDRSRVHEPRAGVRGRVVVGRARLVGHRRRARRAVAHRRRDAPRGRRRRRARIASRGAIAAPGLPLGLVLAALGIVLLVALSLTGGARGPSA